MNNKSNIQNDRDSSLISIKNKNKNILIVMSFLTWFSSAFIFVQIPALVKEIKIEIFPSADLSTSILMVAITLSISLIARFLGSLVLGSYANTNVIKIIMVSISSLIILTLCQIWIISNLQYGDFSLLLPITFIITRFLIGFFIGGIWPNLGIFALEEYYRKSSSVANNNMKNDDDFREKVKDEYGLKSALIQIGLTFSYLIEVAIIIVITINSESLELFLGPLLPNSNLIPTQFTSLIGCILLVIVLSYWSCYFFLKPRKSNSIENNDTNYNKYKKYHSEFLFLNSKRNSLRDLLTNRKYRSILFNLWFITTGLMYMYYSTVIITPELLYRTQLTYPLQEEWITLIIAGASFIGHISLGFLYFNIQKKKNHLKNKKMSNNESKENEKFNKFYNKIRFLQEWLNEKRKENKDILSIFIVSCIILVVVIISITIYYFVSNSSNYYDIILFMIIVQIILAFLANAPWGLVPSILTSRFPKHFRFLAGSLVYNGGLVISFAAPFFFQQVILYTIYPNNHNEIIPNYYLILIPIFLGSLSVMWGSWRILRDYLPMSNKRNKKYGYFEIRIPKDWKESTNDSKIPIVSLKNKSINEYQLLNNDDRWMLSVYFLRDLNIQSFVDYGISYQIKDIIIQKRKLIKDKDENTNENNEEVYISDTDEEEIFINSKIAKKKFFYINDIKEFFTSLIIPYFNDIYIIFYRNNPDNPKDTNTISRILDTFDVKISIGKQGDNKEIER